MKTIYYYYYLFYTKVIVVANPHTMTTLVLSASQAFLILAFITIYLKVKYCNAIPVWQTLVFVIILNMINYYYYHIKKRAKTIIKTKPKYFNSNKLSIFITIVFVLVSFYLYAGTDDVAKYIFGKYCN